MTDKNPIHPSTFTGGVAYDKSVEKVFAENTGMYIDAHNCDPISQDGTTGDLNKIKGESILYRNVNNNTGYKCIGAIAVGLYRVEFWAHSNITFPSIVRINGVIVLSTVDLGLRQDYPLQLDRNRAGSFSEVSVTDRRTPPYLFNLKDMVDSVSSNKYFSDFDISLYQVNLAVALDTMVFDELVNVGGGGGLPVGNYQYQLRYASKEGDVTRWSHSTPMIPIMETLSSDSIQYPWVKTYGGPPNPSSVTSFAPKFRFRVTNIYNYDYIEIKRISYNAGAGIEQTSNGVVVARFSVQPGEISVREYIDPQESNENIPLSVDDETRQVAFVEKAESIRYYDRRLVLGGLTFPTRQLSLTFEELNESKGWTVIEKLGKPGYNDPWNIVNRKSFMRGEIEGFGVNVYDGVGNQGFTQKYDGFKAFQFPNRRDEAFGPTLDFSFQTPVRAANTSTNAVSLTHEVFDVFDGVSKEDNCNFKNIIEKGRVLGITGTKLAISLGGIKEDCDETNAEIEAHGANVDLALNTSVSYQPFHPVKQNDSNVTGHGYRVNTRISTNNNNIGPIVFNEGDGVTEYRPRGFAPDYYAMGIMFAGIDNFPSWAKAFSVVRTDNAKRVLCQGIGYYALTKGAFKLIGNASLGGKETKKVWFYAPDIDAGIVSSESINDIIDNPQNYKIQCVSPLGFFSEWYSAEDNFLEGERDRCIDMISYLRIIREHESDEGQQMNPRESATMGIPGGDSFNYVCHDKWRNQSIGNIFQNDPAMGNKIVGISSIKRKSEGRGSYLEIELDQDIYITGLTGGNSQSHFEDDGLKNWSEPVFIMNIIRTGATVRDNDVQKYRQTNHYQKIESIIGKSTGVAAQRFQLVDERWEDCIPAPNSTDFGASNDRFLYIKKADGAVEKWMNVTYKTTSQINVLTNNALNQVGDVRGLYRHTNIGGTGRRFEINFNVNLFIPEDGDVIMVRYDKTAPIRVFGGDTFLGEGIFAPIDSQSSAREKAAETQFPLGIGLPYKDFKINPRFYTIRKAGANINAVQDKEWFTLGFIRQLCVMATLETRACLPLAFNKSTAPEQFFPLINYVIRPNRWDADKDKYKDNHIFDDYGDDYGATEQSMWKWGGFRFLPQINPDYSIEPPLKFFSRPEFGFTEILDFPTMIMHSLPRAINVQNSPGLKTFPANNTYIIDDNQGAIKYLWEETSDSGGENLYAFANTGICLLLTKKSILTELTGGDLAVMAADGFIKTHVWKNKEIGMYDEFWRGAAEALIPIQLQDNTEVLKQAIFFPSRQSVYRFMDGNLQDIAEDYHSRLYNNGLSLIGPGLTNHVTGVFDRYTKRYYLNMTVNDENINFMYSQKLGNWIGTCEFAFERYTSDANKLYGHKNMQTFLLNDGYIINGNPINMRVTAAAAPDPSADKEFIRFKINSNKKPDTISFMKTKGGVVQTSILAADIRDYRGYEQNISRISALVDPDCPRLQGRYVVFEISETSASEFRISDTGVSWKKLKL